jgi:hypothetical protein
MPLRYGSRCRPNNLREGAMVPLHGACLLEVRAASLGRQDSGGLILSHLPSAPVASRYSPQSAAPWPARYGAASPTSSPSEAVQRAQICCRAGQELCSGPDWLDPCSDPDKQVDRTCFPVGPERRHRYLHASVQKRLAPLKPWARRLCVCVSYFNLYRPTSRSQTILPAWVTTAREEARDF